MNHQQKTASSLVRWMLLENGGVSKGESLYFIGKGCFFWFEIIAPTILLLKGYES
jgi:hypothetical protein